MKRHGFIFWSATAAFIILTLSACITGGDGTEGLTASSPTGGPEIVFDPLADPIPEVPMPIDVITQIDPSSPTGRRINIRAWAPTELERDLRQKLNSLDGFGTIAPITVTFTEPLDLTTATNDSILLINIDPRSDVYGSRIPLDLGMGNFPLTIEDALIKPDGSEEYFANDPMRFHPDILFGADNHMDLNKDGILQENEYVDFYEVETHTLVLRPVFPMEQQSRYAVVLTKELKGEDGNPVSSPWGYVHHAAQTLDLLPLKEILPGYGYDLSDTAFTWSFTTQSVTRDLEAIRDGMDGKGALSYLPRDYPQVISWLGDTGIPALGNGNPNIMKIDNLSDLITLIIFFSGFMEEAEIPLGLMVDILKMTLKTVDYLVFGTFESPIFITEDRIFDLDYQTGKATIKGEDVVFLMAVPKPGTAGREPPFPVVFYSHGIYANKLDMLLFMGLLCRYGFAVVAISDFGHGPPIEIQDTSLLAGELPPWIDLLVPLFRPLFLDPLTTKFHPDYPTPGSIPGDWGLGDFLTAWGGIPLFKALAVSRAPDCDGDGYTDSGCDALTADLFYAREVLRQSAVDHMQLIRTVKNFGDVNGDGILAPMEGDFNQDGIVDVGGLEGKFFHMPISFGSLFGSLLAAVDPLLTATIPIAAGGGLTDMTARTTHDGVTEKVFGEALGPVIYSLPESKGGDLVSLAFDVAPSIEHVIVPIGEARIRTGDRVVARNLENGETDETVMPEDGRLRLAVESDQGDTLEITVFDGQSREVTATLSAPAPVKGHGFDRNTPEFRQFLFLGQTAISKGDPVNYSPHYFNLAPARPEEFDYRRKTLPGVPDRNVLILSLTGDPSVSTSSGIAIGRTAGMIEPWANQTMIDQGVLQGVAGGTRKGPDGEDIYVSGEIHVNGRNLPYNSVLYDVDDPERNNEQVCANKPPDVECGIDEEKMHPPIGPLAALNTPSGRSATRFLYTPEGAHGLEPLLSGKEFNFAYYYFNMFCIYLYHDGSLILDDNSVDYESHSMGINFVRVNHPEKIVREWQLIKLAQLPEELMDLIELLDEMGLIDLDERMAYAPDDALDFSVSVACENTRDDLRVELVDEESGERYDILNTFSRTETCNLDDLYLANPTYTGEQACTEDEDCITMDEFIRAVTGKPGSEGPYLLRASTRVPFLPDMDFEDEVPFEVVGGKSSEGKNDLKTTLRE